MICTKKEFIRTGADGTKWWQVVLTSDTDPDTLNLTGADVENLNDALGLAAGSILITPTANYIAFEDGVFTAKGEGGGGGGATVTLENNRDDSIPGEFKADSETTIETFELAAGETMTKVLPVGSYVVPYWDEMPVNTLINGDGDYEIEIWGPDEVVKVKGNCSLSFDAQA